MTKPRRHLQNKGKMGISDRSFVFTDAFEMYTALSAFGDNETINGFGELEASHIEIVSQGFYDYRVRFIGDPKRHGRFHSFLRGVPAFWDIGVECGVSANSLLH